MIVEEKCIIQSNLSGYEYSNPNYFHYNSELFQYDCIKNDAIDNSGFSNA